MKLLVLVTDAFGGRGGIAMFNRELLRALCTHANCKEVVALPRVIAEPIGEVPAQLTFCVASAAGKARYATMLAAALTTRRFDAVVCGHLNLLPLAAVAAFARRVPLLLIIHGVEAWKNPRSRALKNALRRVDVLVSVSDHTRRRFEQWAGSHVRRTTVIPNCIDTIRFTPGPKCAHLIERYGLNGRRVLLTVARLSAAERYKGIDEVLRVLPALTRDVSNLSYLIVGDGDDRQRLETLARDLGVADRVVFAGHITEQEKVDHYRLADAYVMPGRGEGFGIVYLEALACGIPVVASTADASVEAICGGGDLGEAVDPDQPDEIGAAILRALERQRRIRPDGMEEYSVGQFRMRWHAIVDELLRASASDRFGDAATAMPPSASAVSDGSLVVTESKAASRPMRRV